MNNNISKIYLFKDNEDYIFYLQELIIDVIQKSKRLKKYQDEIETVLNTNQGKKLIETEYFESLSDRTSRLFQYIFNLIGDETKQAVSYRKFRKILYKNKRQLNLEITSLTQNEEFIIDQFNKLRNWALHIPESIYVHKKEFYKIDNKFINETRMNVVLDYYKYFEIEYLEKLKDEIIQVLKSVEIILARMKDDYSKLVGGKAEFKEEIFVSKPYAIMEVAHKSWNTQKGNKQ